MKCIFPEMDVYRLCCACSLFFLFFCISPRVYSQANTAILDHTVKFPHRNVRLDTLLQTITRQTEVRFSYNSRRLKTSYPLRLSANTLTVRQILDELKLSTGVLYSVIEDQVILNIDKSTVQQPAKQQEPNAADMQLKTAQHLSAVKASTQNSIPLQDSVQSKSVDISRETLKIDSTGMTSSTSFNQITTSRAADLVSDSTEKLNQPSVRVANQSKIDSVVQKTEVSPTAQKALPKKQKYFVDAGVSIEETLFIGANIAGGVPAFFASAAVKSNGKSVIFLYGIGTSFQIKKKSRLLLSAHYGTYSKALTHTEIDPSDTTLITYKVGVTGAWARIGAGIEWKLNPSGNWKFYVGMTVNVLESRYTVDGKKSGLGVLSASEPEKEYSAFYPFYTITNTYNDTAITATKTWIGVQVGVSYTIFHR